MRPQDWVEEDTLSSAQLESVTPRAERKPDLASVLEANRKRRNGSTDLAPKQVEDPPVDD
jgi:hypothetical protein